MTQNERRERDRDIVAAIRDSALTVQQVADQFGVGFATINAVCKRNGVTCRGYAAARLALQPSGLFRILAELLNTDDTCSAIARRLGISRERVSQIHRQALAAGIKLEKRKPNAAATHNVVYSLAPSSKVREPVLTLTELVLEAYHHGYTKPRQIVAYALREYGRIVKRGSVYSVVGSLRSEGRLPGFCPKHRTFS
jgi:transposase-like protein